MGATKLSILFSYRRVFFQPAFSYFAKVVIWLVFVFTICCLIVTVFQCGSPVNIWQRTAGGSCINQNAFWFCVAAFNIVTDFIILGMPAATILGLELSCKQKLSLMCVLSCGGFVCLTSILRCVALNPANSHHDIPLAALKAANWSIIETNTGIIWACLPMTKPVLYKCFPRFFKNAFPDLNPVREIPTPLYRLLPLSQDRGLPPIELCSSEASYRVHTTDTGIMALPRPSQQSDLPQDRMHVATAVKRVLVPHPRADRMSRGSLGGQSLLTLEEWLGEAGRSEAVRAGAATGEAEAEVRPEAVGLAVSASQVGMALTTDQPAAEARTEAVTTAPKTD
ncbi:hypothetical protein MMC30_008915 [Trapelia coarctata]|nr:hypothetical protein [Trapelia coarctata]